jgi:hypothetical protein
MLMSSHGGGIDISGSSFVDFSQSTLKKTAYLSKSSVNTPATLWLQNIQSSGITVKGSRAVLGPTHIRSMTLLPGLYIFRLNLPVLAGMTVYGGSTGCFYHPTVFGSGKGVTYTSVIGYKRTSAGRTPFMRVMKMTNEGATYASGNWWGLGNITWSGGLTPVYNQEVSYVGMKLGDAGFDSDRAVRAFLDSGTGNTLEFFAYHDTTEGSTAAKQYLAIGKNSIVLSTEGGVTYIGTTAGYGVTAAFRDIVNGKNRQSCVDLYEFTNNSYDYIDCSYGGDIEIRGNTTLGGTRSYVGMYIYFGSKVTICPPANLSVRDCSHSGILCEWDSSLQSTIGDEGSIIIKHPIGFGVAAGADYNSNYGYGMHARNGGGFGNWGSMVVIGCPLSASAVGNEAGQFNGFFTTDSSAVGVDSSLGVDSSNAPLRFATGSENALSSSGYQGVVAGWDGGAAKESGLVNGMVAQLSSRAVLHGIGAINHIWNTAQGQGSNTPRIMTRGDWGSGSAGQWLYNSPMGATMWWIRTESGWMSSVNNTSATVNTAYKAPLVWGSGYDSVIATPQTAGAFTANPPGYSGPVIKIANSGGHDNELIFRT